MAQDGGEAPKGTRASVGPRRVHKGKRGSNRQRTAHASDQTSDQNTVPVGIIGERAALSSKPGAPQDTEQQEKFAQHRANETDGQQQRRKSRRSRSRNRRDNAHGNGPRQELPNTLSEEKRSHGGDHSHSVNVNAISGRGDAAAASRASQPSSGGTPGVATGLADGDQPKANHEKPAASASESGASSARKSSRRRKRGAKARANGNGDGGNPVAGAARDTRPASGNAHQAPDTSTRSKAAEFPKGSIIDEQNRNRSVRKRREAALNQKAAGQKGQPNSGAQADGRRAQNRAQDAQVAVQRPHADHETETYAALDLGTNNCRLLVAEPYGQSFRVIDAFSRIVRLGEGLSQSGRLSEEAQDRAIAALKVCQSKLNYRAVKRFRLIATEACRRAVNGPAFLNRVHRETGLRLEIVNRETEARLAVAGCASLVHPEADGVVLFDIGGGSSEIVWLDLDKVSDDNALHPGEKRNRQTRRSLRHLSERIRCWTSLQVGVVTLSEKHGGKVVTREHFESMVEDVRGMLGQFEEREALAKAIETKHIHMLGTSGTVTTLAGVHLGLERYDRRQVDGTWLTATELRDMIGRVLDMNFQERMNNPCIGADRADLVLAGCAILEAFHREWPCSQLRVADRGLREGILMEMMIDDGVWNPQTSQPGKKAGPKKKRSRRRGGRGHRGGHGKVKTAESK